MFCIQYINYDEGTGALWHEVPNNRRYETKEEAIKEMKRLRLAEDEDEESLVVFRVTKVDSREYYSQPTDRREY